MNQRLAHDHAELGNLLGEVNAALDAKVIARSHASLDRFWARLAVHIRAEHLRLFPAVLDALSGSRENIPSADEALNAIEELRRDHDFFMHELSVATARQGDLHLQLRPGTDVALVSRVRNAQRLFDDLCCEKHY